MAEGWEALNNLNNPKKGLVDNDLDKNIRECFSTPSGKIVLDWLINITLDKSSLTQGSDGASTALLMAFREGENNIVRLLKNKMKVKKND
jgi:hypothetical protein